MHDLTIKTIAEYVSGRYSTLVHHNYHNYINKTLVNLQRVNKRFYQIRLCFIQQIFLGQTHSHYAYDHQPYGWNRVYQMYFYSDKNLVDCTSLSFIRKLSLNNCQNLIDVSPLSKVYHLELSYCHQISDVSPLSKVHHLSLWGCDKIIDVSALGTVHSLYILYTKVITDVSALGKVHKLVLNNCRGINDISALNKVPHLEVWDCGIIPNIGRGKFEYY